MYVLDCRCTIVAKRPHRLVVRTSRCGRDNPGSTPGVVNFLPTSYTTCHKQVRLLVSSTFHRPRDTSLCLIRREPAQPGRLSAGLLTLWAWPRALTVAALSVQSQTLSALGTKWPPHTEAHPAQPSDTHLGGPSPGPEYREPCIRHISTGWTLYLLASWAPRAPFCMGSCCFSPHAEGSMRLPNKAMSPHVHRMCLCSVMTLGALCMCVFTSVYFLANPSEGHECVSASPGLSIAWKASVPEAKAGRRGGRGR